MKFLQKNQNLIGKKQKNIISFKQIKNKQKNRKMFLKFKKNKAFKIKKKFNQKKKKRVKKIN